MQIIIPMSGFGERFRREGYKLPKPLILVDGKPIIKYVIDMFPGDNDFIFICNRDHLITPEYKMAETLRLYCPEAKIIPIAPHKLGPVNAILEARESIDLDKPTIINYCDFTCYWDFEDFKKFVNEVDCDGSVPAYKGFHPHSLGSTFYAYMKHTSLWMDDIQEKQPWTDTPTNEYSSSGTYYFRTGQLCLNAFDEQIAQGLDVNGEFYVSLAYRVLKQNKKKIAIYELQHFMQWGTPSDLEEYIGWSNTFRRLGMDTGLRARHSGTLLVPMAGLGSRFAREGYKLAKPLIPVSGRAMSIQAIRNLPETPLNYFYIAQRYP
jgi:NDP-sugar pyrophosphorylase family protein